MAAAPLSCVPTGSQQNPASNIDRDRAGLEHVEKECGGQEAALWVVPAKQRFCSLDLTVR
jgi:hypothetical protein